MIQILFYSYGAVSDEWGKHIVKCEEWGRKQLYYNPLIFVSYMQLLKKYRLG
jgi:hypothetical protein